MLHNLAAAEVVNRLLPCGAEYVSASQRGHYINALFKLTDRTGPGGGPHSCAGGVGTTARVDFIISGGKITHWLRAPSQPGDNRRAARERVGDVAADQDRDITRHQHRPARNADGPDPAPNGDGPDHAGTGPGNVDSEPGPRS